MSFRVRGAGTVTRDAEESLRNVTRELCEKTMEEAREHVTRNIQGTFHAQLRAIQRRSFPGRRVRFLDAMGSASVDVWDRDGAHTRVEIIGRVKALPSYYDRSPGVRDITALLEWYADVSQDANVCIDELDLQPLED